MTADSSGSDNEGLIARAQNQMGQGDLVGASENLCKVLSNNPDHALAHALLALCLIDQTRLAAGEHEARLAVALAPELPLCHFALGMLALAHQDTSLAEGHFRDGLECDAEDQVNSWGLARAYLLRKDYRQALDWVDRALVLDPEWTNALVLKGQIHLERNDVEQAEQQARLALGLDPEDIEACVLLGNVRFLRKDDDAARDLATMALSRNPRHVGAVMLMVMIRSRRNPLLGLWWSYASLMLRSPRSIQVLTLVVGYLGLNALMISRMHDHAGHWVWWAAGLWLAFCALTWAAPDVLGRAIDKELAASELKPDY